MKVFDYICKSPKFKYFFKHPTDNILFFDIETTGLSPKASSLYMIGVMFFDNSDGSWHLKQFFADNYKSEADMINSFLDILEDYDYLYHFNGKTFDIPYVLNKCSKHSISLSEHCDNILNDKENSFSIDILAGIRPVKKMLGLTKANQTALEKWLGIIRDDKFDGGKLIPVYTDFMHPPRQGSFSADQASIFLSPLAPMQSGLVQIGSSSLPLSRSPARSEIQSFIRPAQACPTCQGLPLWGSWRVSA